MRTMFLVVSLACMLGLAQQAAAGLRVFACEPEWGALARELGGEHVSVFSATTAQQDPHRIQARPSLIAKARRADLLICTGADLEIGWLPVLLRQAANPSIQPGREGYFMATEHVRLLDAPSRLDRAEGDVHPYGNPHIQTDPRRIARVAEALASRLADLDPPHASDYGARYSDFAQRWQEAVKTWEARAASLSGVRTVAHHKGWVYLNDWLGLDQVAVLEPKPSVSPGAAHLAQVSRQLEKAPARMVIRAAYQDPRPTEWLAERTGIPLAVLPFTVGGSERADNLFSLFDDTVDRLLKAAK